MAALLSVRGLDQEGYLVFATERGLVKRTALKEYQNLGQAGLIAIRLQEGDRLVGVALSDPEDEAILATQEGQAIRFPLEEVRATGRDTQGVIGVRFKKPEDRVVSLVVVKPGEMVDLLSVSTRGYGKRTPFPSTPSRAGAGWGSSPTPSPPRWGGSPPCSRSGAGRTSWSSPVGASPSAPPWPRSGSTPGPPPASG